MSSSTSAASLRAPCSPYGVPIAPLFFGNTPNCTDFKDASKIKTLDVHPALPWVVTADESGRVTVWDYAAELIVLTLHVDALKDSQRAAIEALELHGAFAGALDVAVPDAAGPGLGCGVGVEPGATAGGATEAFITERVAASGGAGGGEGGSGEGGGGGGGAKRSPSALLSALPEDARSLKTGAVRCVRFADEHVLAAACGGCARGGGGGGGELGLGAGGLASSLDELETRLRPGGGGSTLPQPSWLIIICDFRAFLFDYVTRSVIDVPYPSLLVEASLGGLGGVEGGGGGGGGARSKPNAFSASLIGPGVVAFGCEDGAVRVWAADVNAVVQVCRPPTGSGNKPVVSLTPLSTLCRDKAGGGGGTPLSPGCPLGASVAAAHMLLLAGAQDGSVTTWEVRGGGRQLGDYARPVRAGGELSAPIDVCAASQGALALGGDKTVTVWEASHPGAGRGGAGGWGGGAPRVASTRLVTSSTAAEGGAGSRLSAAVMLGSHPSFPPGTLLVAGKGPHLELALPGGALAKGGGAPPGLKADEGIIIYDLRSARPGLPSKLKVYVLARHPLRPDVIAVGTNIGIFVVSLCGGTACAAAAIVGHAEWVLPPTVLPSAAGEAPRVREGVAVLHVTASGALVATEVGIATAREAGAAGGAAPRRAGAGASTCSLTQTESVLMAQLAPHLPPPNTTLPPGLPGSPPPPHNAWAHLAALLKGNPLLPPGTRGVRLRLSGTGRFLAAVWPEHKCFAIFKISRPSPDSEGVMQGWGCEFLSSGVGVDVAWSHPSAAFSPSAVSGGGAAAAAAQRNAAAAASGTVGRFERFAVLVPGQAITGRGPMGGGRPLAHPLGAGEGKRRRREVAAHAPQKCSTPPPR